MTPKVAKAVFDTNILVSGHFWKGTAAPLPPGRGSGPGRAGSFGAYRSELREKLTDRFGLPVAEVDAIIGRFGGWIGSLRQCPVWPRATQGGVAQLEPRPAC